MDAFVSIVVEKLKLLLGKNEEVDKLLDSLQMIHPYLHDAEMRQFNEPEVAAWLTRLKYVAYEADDVLDEWQTTKSQQLSIGAYPVSNFFAQCSCFHQLALNSSIGKKIQEVNGKLDLIDSLSKKPNFLKSSLVTTVTGEGTDFPSVIRNARKTTSSVEEIFGREDEINSIKDKLMNSSETSKHAVVSIVGPAGCGKTTLAKYVFNDGDIVQHFKERIWVCVSDEFDDTSIMRKIIDATTKVAPSAGKLKTLRKKIVDEVLKDKLFLLVLDDVWNEDYGKWEKLFNVIKNCGLRGSRILMTTRSENVCKVVGSAHMFQVGIISSFENCWSIFESVAFENRDETERPELRMVGEEIVKKCKGVPLAIKTVAGALRTTMRKEDWENVLESSIWDWEPKSEMGILPALLLSYYHLSPQLKQCFRYCAIYPKDYLISKDEIVQQWIAHGYVAEKKNMEMEDVAENYFDELVACSLFRELELDIYDNVKHYKMHDLVHDLALFVTKGEFLFINNENNIEFDTQYPPLHCTISDMESLNNIEIDVERLRTFISTSCERELCVGDCQIEEMQRLRVLELNSWSFENMPDVVGKLVHLRFLKLCKGQFKASSSSIEKLQNLQYLDLSWASIEALPESVGKLKKLRHLNLSYNPNFMALPSAIGRLTNLRKLDLKGTSLDKIPDCIGKLGLLWYLNLEATGIRGLPSAIGRLTSLIKLDLNGTSLDEIPDCIGNLGSLRYLNLAGTRIRGLPESIKDLSLLQVLDVSYCRKLKNLPHGIFDKLIGLKQLGINGISLQHGLPAGIGKLSHLQRLDKFWVLGNHEEEVGSSSSFSSSSNIGELRDLNHLRGSLDIYNLNMVTSKEEAASAQLHDKTLLSRLALGWGTVVGRVVEEKTTSEHVLQALRPCVTLRALSIVRYPGHTIPTWLGTLSGLQQLCLYNWDEVTNLPALGNLPELRRLCIAGMPKVTRVGTEWLGSKHGFPKVLECLKIMKMAEWEEWDILEEKSFFAFPSLRKFQIYRCPKLRSLPPIFSTSLREIYVDECSNLRNWLGILPAGIVTLKSISAEWVKEMPSFHNLECLGIRGDGRVSELSSHLVRLGSLKTLEIQNCPNLESLPREMAFLEQLQKLEIYDCPKLKGSCNKDGTQWYKIQHFPNITIDGIDVGRNA